MKLKYLALNDTLYKYVCECRSHAQDPVLDELRIKTEGLGDVARMQISREQGSLLTLLTAVIGVRRALEIGTFTGYSALCIARGLPANGRLICVDQDPAWTKIARDFWERAGVQTKIQLHLSDAITFVENLAREPEFDLVFIDAEKTEYDRYFELVLPRVRPNGLIIFDNMLWGGKLGSGPVEDPAGQTLDALNRKLAADPRVESVLLPVADGIQLCRKRVS